MVKIIQLTSKKSEAKIINLEQEKRKREFIARAKRAREIVLENTKNYHTRD